MLKVKGLHLALSLAAITVAVLRTSPHLVFKVPKIGWLLGAASGYGFSPFLDKQAFARCYDEASCPWLKSGDVVVDVCGKCGTNWMMTAVHELRTWNQPELRHFKDILDIAPWPEFVPHPEASKEHPDEEFGPFWNNSRFRFREFKSHAQPYDEDSKGIRTTLLPIRERRDVKFLVMVRNPADVVYSMANFLGHGNQEWYRMWGDAPRFGASVSSMLDLMTLDSYMSPFKFFHKWMNFAGEENVLILHYSNVLKDTKKNLRIIADFIGLTDIPESVLDDIEKRVGFEFMKKRGDHYRHFVGVKKSIPLIQPNGLMKRGGVGSSKGVMTDEERQKVEVVAKAELGSKNYDLMANGFEAIRGVELDGQLA